MALLANTQPNRQTEHLFQVPWKFLPECLPHSPDQQDKAHPHVVLSTFQSVMTAAESLNILMERVIQISMGFFSFRPGGQGPILHLRVDVEASPPKGAEEVRGHPLSQRQGGLRLQYLTFACVHQRL